MIAHVVAIAQNNCIGKNGTLPWHLPEDLRHFKAVTDGHVVLMGRKTWESLPEKFRPLPNRINIVITRNANYLVPTGVELFTDLDAALRAHAKEDIMIIGGAEIFRQTMDLADTLYITHVQQTVEGDAFYPEINFSVWKETEREDRDGYSFVTYVRNG
ncbi:MAG: hypothetical protein COU35_03325 [Candidatus Magasanikbacteria bacterium CG10_big_fil_rev_8_21_14_0_10_47_10]|uniref:Dihydrofolate reductase n=1 Tax=Candidatus Magasanikbacteria bacterium CG10_big_fil_rev_8_21_14_0_10_47_10 TaxID=1974652 RepID=A0A2H0TQ67_9BACT|nr:MAG: hypothetical protein COU35_03325 [Candidatus Magasanikbacteria bacterium CG10_big_fil_rev_8_21_14_0_10_47_10]